MVIYILNFYYFSGLDIGKINQIIAKASEGSKFYEHKKQAQKKLDDKIEKMLEYVKLFTTSQIQISEKEVLNMYTFCFDDFLLCLLMNLCIYFYY